MTAAENGNWYMVNRDGMATLCADREDAEKEAKDADMAWPHSGPHRAVQLVEASTAGFTAADMATAEARGFRDGAASLSASAGEPMFWVRLCSDGLYEGPIHNARIEEVRKQSGVWSPLYLAAPPTAQAEGWISVQDELPKCSKKPDSFGVEVLIWPPHEDGSRTAFYGRRQSREPNFYKYGALLGHVEFWRYPPLPPTSAEGVEHG